MNRYEEKKAARIERLQRRIERLEAFAKGKDLSMFGESRSGIPLGQPILVGHHSERRHRRHLQRIERIVRAGYDAQAKAAQLKQRIFAINENKSIASDNPDARALLESKIKSIDDRREKYVLVNKMCRSKNISVDALAERILKRWPETKDAKALAANLLTPDFMGRIGVQPFVLSNLSAESRRLKKRLETIDAIQEGFEPFEINGIQVRLEEGQIRVEFPYKPNEATREKLKRSPLALKWSSWSKCWVRKHTETTMGRYFNETLKEVLQEASE